MNRPKIFGIGLPRCAGQTLQRALSILTQDVICHSLDSPDQLGNAVGTVECWWPIATIEKRFPGSKYILNTRDANDWLKSCESVYAGSKTWNNPIWKYPIEAFCDYRAEYLRARFRPCLPLSGGRPLAEGRMLIVDLIDDPCWQPLAEFLQVPVPTAVPFPRVDRVKQLKNASTLNPDMASTGLFELYGDF